MLPFGARLQPSSIPQKVQRQGQLRRRLVWKTQPTRGIKGNPASFKPFKPHEFHRGTCRKSTATAGGTNQGIQIEVIFPRAQAKDSIAKSFCSAEGEYLALAHQESSLKPLDTLISRWMPTAVPQSSVEPACTACMSSASIVPSIVHSVGHSEWPQARALGPMLLRTCRMQSLKLVAQVHMYGVSKSHSPGG